MFALDDGRPRLVQPMQPAATAFLRDCRLLLADHLATIVGEPLFVVRTRAGAPEHADVPEVLALDATGRPVVVDAAPVVDDAVVVAVLRRAGAADRMTAADMARAYHPDPARFTADYAAFRERSAFGSRSAGRPGARLVLVCGEVAVEAGDTLTHLRAVGHAVDVLQVGVVRGADDSRMLDVSPLATFEAARRAVEPATLRLVRHDDPAAGPRAADLPSAEDPAAGWTAEERISPAEAWAQWLGSARTPPPQVPSQTPPPHQAIPTHPPEPPYRADPPGQPSPSDLSGQPSPTPPDDPAAPDEPPTRLHPLVPVARWPQSPEPDPRTVPTTVVSAPAPSTLTPIMGLRMAAGQVPPRPAGTPAPHVALMALAASRRAVTPLVWRRERRGQRLVAQLRVDGLLELPDGRVYGDPCQAAAAAAEVEHAPDGWRAWRLGDGGPTLAQAAGIVDDDRS